VDPGHSLAHQASARLKTWAASSAALSVAESPAGRQSARRLFAYRAVAGPDNRLCRLSKPSLEKEVTWDRTPLGVETAAPFQPRAALAAEGSERRWNPRNSKVPALHREAECDTTGSFSRQHPVHTWIRAWVQGKRRSAATLRLIHQKDFKVQLTLWSYCGKRAARRLGIRWRAAQIIVFCWDAR
jgi:hypothetical protein